MNPTPADETTGWSLGPVLILVGSMTLALAQGIPDASLGNNQDPGPRAFPVALAALLILGGAYELGRAFFNRRRRNPLAPNTPGSASLPTMLSRPENHDVLILVGALVLYLAAMPWVGFPVNTLLFSTGMMRRLGSRWGAAICVSAGLVLIIHLLFVMLFRVQLPAGVLGLSW